MLSKINPDPKNAFSYIKNVYLNYILGLFMKKQVKAPVKMWFCPFWALFRRNLPLFDPISTFELISFKGFTKFCLFLVEKPNVFYKQMICLEVRVDFRPKLTALYEKYHFSEKMDNRK